MQRLLLLISFLVVFTGSSSVVAQELTVDETRLFLTTSGGASTSLMVTALAFATMTPQQGEDAAYSTTISLEVSDALFQFSELTLLTTLISNRTATDARFSVFLTRHKDALLQDVHAGGGPVLADVGVWLGTRDQHALGRHARRRRAWLTRLLTQPYVDARAFRFALTSPLPST